MKQTIQCLERGGRGEGVEIFKSDEKEALRSQNSSQSWFIICWKPRLSRNSPPPRRENMRVVCIHGTRGET